MRAILRQGVGMACGKCSRAVGEPHQSWCAYDSWLGNHAVDSKRAVTMGAEIEAAEAKRYAAMNHYTEDGGHYFGPPPDFANQRGAYREYTVAPPAPTLRGYWSDKMAERYGASVYSRPDGSEVLTTNVCPGACSCEWPDCQDVGVVTKWLGDAGRAARLASDNFAPWGTPYDAARHAMRDAGLAGANAFCGLGKRVEEEARRLLDRNVDRVRRAVLDDEHVDGVESELPPGWTKLEDAEQFNHANGAVVWFFCSPWSWDLADADERKYLDDEDADPDGYADTREEAMALALGWEKATPYQWINRSRGLSIAMRSDGVWLANSPLDKDPFAVRVCKSIPHAIAAAQGDV